MPGPPLSGRAERPCPSWTRACCCSSFRLGSPWSDCRLQAYTLTLLAEALHRCSRLDQSAVHREVIPGKELSLLRLRQDLQEEFAYGRFGQHSITVLAERRCIEAFCRSRHVQKPLKE